MIIVKCVQEGVMKMWSDVCDFFDDATESWLNSQQKEKEEKKVKEGK